MLGFKCGTVRTFDEGHSSDQKGKSRLWIQGGGGGRTRARVDARRTLPIPPDLMSLTWLYLDGKSLFEVHQVSKVRCN